MERRVGIEGEAATSSLVGRVVQGIQVSRASVLWDLQRRHKLLLLELQTVESLGIVSCVAVACREGTRWPSQHRDDHWHAPSPVLPVAH